MNKKLLFFIAFIIVGTIVSLIDLSYISGSESFWRDFIQHSIINILAAVTCLWFLNQYLKTKKNRS